MTRGDSSTRETILNAAWELFAALGYDGTGGEMIADAAGVPAAEIGAIFGNKLGLYREILKRAHDQDMILVQEMAANYTRDRDGLHFLVDRYLDYCCENPRVVALWMQRKMRDAADLDEVEREYASAPLAGVGRMVGDLFRPGLDAELTSWMIIWFIQIFVHSGIPDEHGRRVGCEDTQQLRRFRRQVHEVVDALLADA